MIKNVDDYFDKGCGRCDRFATADCSTKRWDVGLKELRRICLLAGLNETAKWGHPCYMHAGRNIAILGALRNDFRLSFFQAALMKDPNGVLEKQGPNTQHADMIRFIDSGQVAEMESIILSYLQEAMSYAEAGIKPAKKKAQIELPTELVDAIASDPELAEAFAKLSSGRQRSYVINLNSAKKPETRIARIARFRNKILSGKGANER
ncbi:hypothetical protein FYK55_15220 [Roseiconus nitratireducens]|uniref:YdhG-like domain-containing protein n=1 Tax=Roseiconus nitratireducens TaxID=2605748 RepID=A0A5M6D3S0_9BACT|nr:YdeI/OmpD-associated family protein [Roseiconus nitratireducens]KAA5542158.1 hypothetical protein FYK55_15220 [Roseiconus nitratireducens]